MHPEHVEQEHEQEDDRAQRDERDADEGEWMSFHSSVATAYRMSATSERPTTTATVPITRPMSHARRDGGPASGAPPATACRAYSAGRSSFSSSLRDAAGEDHHVHRELLRPEVAVEEVDREDEADREQRLFAVDEQRDVEDPAGHEVREEPPGTRAAAPTRR